MRCKKPSCFHFSANRQLDQYKFATEINWILQFYNGFNKVVIKLCVMQFWSGIILVISNRTNAERSSDFKKDAYDFKPNCTPFSSIIIINQTQHSMKVPMRMPCNISRTLLHFQWFSFSQLKSRPIFSTIGWFYRFQASDFSQRYYICYPKIKILIVSR